MQKLSGIILILFMGNLRVSLCLRDYNIDLERLETIKGDEETLIEYFIRLTRKGHGDARYIANGNMIYTEDLGEDVTHAVTTTYSASGTSQFRTHPYTVQKSNICEFFKTYYRQHGQSWIQGHTDFPVIPAEGICPLPKGNFYVKHLEFDDVKLPYHAPRGLWKIEQKFERNGKVIGGLAMYAKITDKV